MVKIEKGRVKIEEEVNIRGEYDVIVVGGGMAGVGAAISSSREGMKTLLIEEYGALDELVTLGLVCYLAGYSEGIGKKSY